MPPDPDDVIVTPPDPAAEAFYTAAITRIRNFMLVLAPILTVAALLRFGFRPALGFLLGCIISYLNFTG